MRERNMETCATNTLAIVSLHELNVNLSNELENYFADSFKHLYNEDSEEKSKEHVHRVLCAMKTSPQRTICRVQQHETTSCYSTLTSGRGVDVTETTLNDTNNISITRMDRVKRDINHYIEKWITERQSLIVNNNDCDCNENDIIDYSVNVTNSSPFHIVVDDHAWLEHVVTIEISHTTGDATEDHDQRSKLLVMNSYHQRIPNMIAQANNVIHDNDDNRWKTKFPHWSSKRLRQEYGWPVTHRVVVCDRYCGEAVVRGSDIYVRGIMMADSPIQENEIVAVYADCSDDDTKIQCRGMILNEEVTSGLFVYLGLGQSVCKRSHMFNQSTGLGIRMLLQSRSTMNASHTKMTILPPCSGLLSNEILLQNEPSILVAQTLLSDASHRLLENDTKRDEDRFDDRIWILDMCCAPGGKTLELASIAYNLCCCSSNNGHHDRPKIQIIAADKSRKKVLAAKHLFEEMNANAFIIPLSLDSTKCVHQDCSSEKFLKVSEVRKQSSLYLNFISGNFRLLFNLLFSNGMLTKNRYWTRLMLMPKVCTKSSNFIRNHLITYY